MCKDIGMLNQFTKDRNAIDSMEYALLDSHTAFEPESGLGISKYRAQLGNNATLDALLVNQGSDILFVSCHGALGRKETILPRFERLRTFQNTRHSSLFFGDPTLHLKDNLSLAWYTGWKELDLYPILAEWVRKSAAAIGATKIIFLGSSGGGFASLQISSYIPGSIAVPLSPQTRISRYAPQGTFGHQRNYVKCVMPHLTPEGGVDEIGEDSNWDAPLGERSSTLERYSQPLPNQVLYVQNSNDHDHRKGHYLPFREVVESGPNRDRVRFYIYDGPERHTSPSSELMQEIIDQAVSWAQETQEPGATA